MYQSIRTTGIWPKIFQKVKCRQLELTDTLACSLLTSWKIKDPNVYSKIAHWHLSIQGFLFRDTQPASMLKETKQEKLDRPWFVSTHAISHSPSWYILTSAQTLEGCVDTPTQKPFIGYHISDNKTNTNSTSNIHLPCPFFLCICTHLSSCTPKSKTIQSDTSSTVIILFQIQA